MPFLFAAKLFFNILVYIMGIIGHYEIKEKGGKGFIFKTILLAALIQDFSLRSMMSYILPPKTTDDLPRDEVPPKSTPRPKFSGVKNELKMLAAFLVGLIILRFVYTLIDLWAFNQSTQMTLDASKDIANYCKELFTSFFR